VLGGEVRPVKPGTLLPDRVQCLRGVLVSVRRLPQSHEFLVDPLQARSRRQWLRAHDAVAAVMNDMLLERLREAEEDESPHDEEGDIAEDHDRKARQFCRAGGRGDVGRAHDDGRVSRLLRYVEEHAEHPQQTGRIGAVAMVPQEGIDLLQRLLFSERLQGIDGRDDQGGVISLHRHHRCSFQRQRDHLCLPGMPYPAEPELVGAAPEMSQWACA
jgi:hypothetical protein